MSYSKGWKSTILATSTNRRLAAPIRGRFLYASLAQRHLALPGRIAAKMGFISRSRLLREFGDIQHGEGENSRTEDMDSTRLPEGSDGDQRIAFTSPHLPWALRFDRKARAPQSAPRRLLADAAFPHPANPAGPLA